MAIENLDGKQKKQLAIEVTEIYSPMIKIF